MTQVSPGTGRRPTSAPGSYSDVLARSQRHRPDGSPVWPLRTEDFGDPSVPRLPPAERRDAAERVRIAAQEPWWLSLLLWIGVIAAGCCIPLYFVALGVGHGW